MHLSSLDLNLEHTFLRMSTGYVVPVLIDGGIQIIGIAVIDGTGLALLGTQHVEVQGVHVGQVGGGGPSSRTPWTTIC